MIFDKKSPSNELQSFEGPNTPKSVSMHSQYIPNTGDFTSKDQPRRINPDSHKMLWIAVGLVGFVGAISFMVSFAGLVAVAEWAGLPPAMRWAVPIFIDAAILVYSIAVLIHRSRGEKTWASWTSLGAFTLVSVLANVGHVLLMPERSTNEFQTLIGALVAGMAPIGVFAATEELGRMAIARPQQRQARDTSPVQVGECTPNPTPPTTQPDNGTTPIVAALEPVAENNESQANPDLETATANVAEVPDRAAEEERIIHNLLTKHGKDLTAHHIADALGKVLRTGQRKLAKLQKQNPEIFTTTGQKAV